MGQGAIISISPEYLIPSPNYYPSPSMRISSPQCSPESQPQFYLLFDNVGADNNFTEEWITVCGFCFPVVGDIKPNLQSYITIRDFYYCNVQGASSYWIATNSEGHKPIITVCPTRYYVDTDPVPLFDLPTIYCIDEEPIELPTTLHGVSGDWEPSEVNRSSAGEETYIFTPNGDFAFSHCPLTVDIKVENCAVKLDMKLFLQGPMNAVTSYSVMTNNIQVPKYSYLKDLKLPVQNPYISLTDDPQGEYTQINNPAGPAGAVVDWIEVEIWTHVDVVTRKYDLVTRRALLLKPDGSVVDTLGQMPQFEAYPDSVQIVVKHRNHLDVIGNYKVSFKKGTAQYDFTDGVDKVYKYSSSAYAPMATHKTGVTCLWAGDIEHDGSIEIGDLNILEMKSKEQQTENYKYLYIGSDLNMDGIVDALDLSLIISNINRSLYSAVPLFSEKTK
jgi:hypothetical protein